MTSLALGLGRSTRDFNRLAVELARKKLDPSPGIVYGSLPRVALCRSHRLERQSGRQAGFLAERTRRRLGEPPSGAPRQVEAGELACLDPPGRVGGVGKVCQLTSRDAATSSIYGFVDRLQGMIFHANETLLAPLIDPEFPVAAVP